MAEKTQLDEYRLALEDCYMLARRMVIKEQKKDSTYSSEWNHIVRFCERAGLKPSIVRIQSE